MAGAFLTLSNPTPGKYEESGLSPVPLPIHFFIFFSPYDLKIYKTTKTYISSIAFVGRFILHSLLLYIYILSLSFL